MSFSVLYVTWIKNRLNENKIILRGFFGKCHSFPSNWKDIEQTNWMSKECIKQCYANKNTNALGKKSNLFIDPRRTRNALFYSRVRPFFRIIFIIGNLSEWYYVIYLRMSDFFMILFVCLCVWISKTESAQKFDCRNPETASFVDIVSIVNRSWNILRDLSQKLPPLVVLTRLEQTTDWISAVQNTQRCSAAYEPCYMSA